MSNDLVVLSADDAEILAETGIDIVEGETPEPAPRETEAQEAPESPIPEKSDEEPDAEREEALSEDDNRAVPLKALHSEREEKRRLRDENTMLQQRMEKMIEGFSRQHNAPDNKTPAHAQGEPTVDDDPLAVLQNLQRQFSEMQAQTTQVSRAQEEDMRLAQAASPYVSSFRQDYPDYDNARAHVLQSIAMAAQLSGADPRQQAMDFERRLAAQSLQRGQNPAEALYAYARQVGYAPASAPATDHPAAAQPTFAETAQGVQKRAEQTRRHRSLSQAGGRSPAGKVTAKDITMMTDAEFNSRMKDPAFFKEMDAQLESLPQV